MQKAFDTETSHGTSLRLTPSRDLPQYALVDSSPMPRAVVPLGNFMLERDDTQPAATADQAADRPSDRILCICVEDEALRRASMSFFCGPSLQLM